MEMGLRTEKKLGRVGKGQLSRLPKRWTQTYQRAGIWKNKDNSDTEFIATCDI
jgi:hypothetical protein